MDTLHLIPTRSSALPPSARTPNSDKPSSVIIFQREAHFNLCLRSVLDLQCIPLTGVFCEILPKNIINTAPYVAVPTKTSYTLPSVTTHMIKANRKIKVAVVIAIIR
ncbi:uncharacterized protein K444DRAFT_612138 [Hyaloscypha bicolor E]|uniref:Uncharacterized protein n=1 Tax=Hyaloscypha bicolor E TaxID=1095630 RepID=A0A2J6TD25_9HELO|nr:uncharacterized protein K444DRAFT_612138 [Hyaloscypha bicolor E]PMD60868.1 hypothetical protein K444DRAFT_612138 [Hyaloscypha bicolor E]